MPDSPPAFSEELELARRLTREAWRRVAHYYETDHQVYHKPEGPVTDADREADAFIRAALAEAYPRDGLLSEEAVDTERRLGRERVWIVDPIDGTRDFIERRGHFAVQIGLATPDGAAGWRPALGAVYHPTADMLYFAERGRGAWVDEPGAESPRRLCATRHEAFNLMTVVATRSHRSPLFLELLDRMEPREIVTMGSLGLKAVRVAEGRADYYVNNSRGRCSEWDLCAPEIIVREAGGEVTDLETGRPFSYNRPDPHLPGGLLVSNGRRHEALRRRILELEIEVKRDAEAG